MPIQEEIDYNTLSREELVKVATDLRVERDMLRRAVRSDIRRFCEDIVPDFLPLGCNRPDCAVASCVAVSLSDYAFIKVTVGTGTVSLLPPDVFACAAGILCAPVIITGKLRSAAAARLCEREGPARTLSVRLRLTSEDDFQFSEYVSLPWADEQNDYQSVFVRVELPPGLITLPDRALRDALRVKSIDLRSTRLTALGGYCMTSATLSQVHLPSTLVSIGGGFLAAPNWTLHQSCDAVKEVHLPPSVTKIGSSFLQSQLAITSIDLRHLTGLTYLGDHFMVSCDSLTEVHLPPTVTQINHSFLRFCPALTSIDLSHLTGLTSLGGNFMSSCDSLTEVHLPPSVAGSLTELVSLRGLLWECKMKPTLHWAGNVVDLPYSFEED